MNPKVETTKVADVLTFSAIVREAAERFPDNEKAWRFIRKRIDLLEGQERDDVMWEAIRRGAKDSLADVRSSERGSIMRMISAPKDSRGIDAMSGATAALIRAMEKSMLDCIIIGGKMLGDLTGKEISVVKANARREEKGWGNRRAFYAEIEKRTPAGKTVRQCVTDAELRKIAQQTMRD